VTPGKRFTLAEKLGTLGCAFLSSCFKQTSRHQPPLHSPLTAHSMSTRNIKQELADPRSSPTIPNTSSRAQTVSSTAETPITHGSPTTRDSPTAHDTPMNLHAGSPDSQATMTNGSQPDRDEHDALKSLGAQSHRLIQGIKKLEELSISATLKSLPKFVVVGDQSAGKSSIVEALCDISLPRSMGTCTR
jgi:hypothetical protein